MDIELGGPWLVGDPGGMGDVDTVPLREFDGTPQVPATSVTGSLRHHLGRQPEIDVGAWMGEVRRDDGDHRGKPSRLRVLGVKLDGGDRSVIRTTTAVDGTTGSALRKTLRREEHIDANTKLTVYLLHPDHPDQVLLRALTTWRPIIGRRRTNGWGQATVTAVTHSTVDLQDRGQLISWLSGGGPEQIDRLLAGVAGVTGAPVEGVRDVLRLRLVVQSGIHVGSGELDRDETGADEEGRRMAVAEVVTRNGKPYVPASSWRGVLRGHAEFVLRSLDCPPDTVRSAVGEVLGDSQRRGLLTFHDATVQAADGGEAATDTREHVGIDRITGGARANLLFAERVIGGVVELRVGAEDPDAVPGWAYAVLGHAVRDLSDGFLAIGGRTSRGLGTLVPDLTDAVMPPASGIQVAELVAATPGEG